MAHERRSAWRTVALLAGPFVGLIVLSVLPNQYVSAQGDVRELTSAAKGTVAIAAWMAIWWLTEATHISTTALLPLVLFPFSGALSMTATAAEYAHPLVFLFLGGFLLALAMQRWGLDRRIALLTLRMVGTRPAAMVGGFMLATAGLSAFVSNTATAAMMLPIALSVVDLMKHRDSPTEASTKLATALLLGIAYAATLGGMTTLIGTPPNAALAAFLSDSVDQIGGVEMSFVGWLKIGLPCSLLLLPLTWFLLTKVLIRLDHEPVIGGQQLIREQLAKLGRPRQAEWLTLLVFVLAATAWIMRPVLNQLEMPVFLGGGYPFDQITDTTIAIAAGLALFLLPADRPGQKRIMNWETARKVPWEILLLFGGGLSLAQAIQTTGVAEFLGVQATALREIPTWLQVLIVISLVVFMTELTSNLATTVTLLPVLAAVAPQAGLHPYLLLFPATLAASCAFMLPVATPPNAIVFGSGYLKLKDLVRVGFWLNLISILWLTLLAVFWIPRALALN